MNKAPRQSISVAMATYNGASYILSQLESIAAQTRLPEEIVVGDDQSRDHTMNIVSEFAANTKLKVLIHRNPARLGSTRNFEQLILRCTGDIIVFSDQDDIWRRDRLERIETAFRKHPHSPYVFSNGAQIDSAGRLISGSLWDSALFGSDEQSLYRAGRGAEVLLRHNVVTGAALAVRRDAVSKALPIPSGWIHDYWLAFVLEALGRGVLLDEPLISYRRHTAQQIGLFSLSKAFETIHRHDELYCRSEAAALRRLAERLRNIDASAHLIEDVRLKASFYDRRASMRRGPGSAPFKILGSWWRGEYRRFTPNFKFMLPAVIPLDVAASLWSLFRRPTQRD